MEANCYNHELHQNVLTENFLNGFLRIKLRMLNVCALGNVRNLYLEEAWNITEHMTDQVRFQMTLENSHARSIHRVDVTDELK